jgi:hypothetical protein
LGFGLPILIPLKNLVFDPSVTIRANLNAVRVFPDFFLCQLVRLKRPVAQNADHFHRWRRADSSKNPTAVPPSNGWWPVGGFTKTFSRPC